MKITKIIRNKFCIFLIQTLILNLVVFYFNYQINLSFNGDTTIEQKLIVQFFANYTLFNILPGLFFIYLIWILVSVIPIIVYINFKKAYSMNLLTFFFPNFFTYVFLSRYSVDYFSSFFLFHFTHTILLGSVLIIFSIGLSIFIKKILDSRFRQKTEDLHEIASLGKKVCPKCGIEFESIPLFCYNCNADLKVYLENVVDKQE
ncbi:MAG: hypothetical protein ACFE9S_09675 [Candidatus Hermodarchaeota archaeon]